MAAPFNKTKRDYTAHAMRLCQEYLYANPGASNDEVTAAIGCKARTVSAARTALVHKGLIRPSYHDRTRRQSSSPPDDLPVSPLDDPNTSFLASLQASAEALTPDEMRRLLSRHARQADNEGNSQVAIAAIQAIARLDSKLGSETTFGPGPPLTSEDKISRLGLILDVCGIDLTVEALCKTFSPLEQADFHAKLGLRLVESSQTNNSTGVLDASESHPSPLEALSAEDPPLQAS